jgi:hypothetical protein
LSSNTFNQRSSLGVNDSFKPLQSKR